MRLLASFLYHKVLGWELIGSFNQESNSKCVIIVVPHTSWHDFYIGLLIRKITGVKINFLGKKELFVGPLGWYMRKVGGMSLDRTSGQNKVDEIAKIFNSTEELRIAIAPEGTRKKVASLKTGFYHIALAANVPIIMVTFDFGEKQNVISEPFYPTGNMDYDFKHIHSFFEGVKGKVPSNSFNTTNS